eukprot:272749-Rhodomonas_salina.1
MPTVPPHLGLSSPSKTAVNMHVTAVWAHKTRRSVEILAHAPPGILRRFGSCIAGRGAVSSSLPGPRRLFVKCRWRIFV